MKFKKTAIAMGLASVVLTGCNSSSSSSDSADFTVTAIDGYIVNGLVTVTCEESGPYEARTNTQGRASFSTDGVSLDGCTAEITGDAETYDTDDGPGTPWTHTMKGLIGLNVINPFTDIGSTFSEAAVSRNLFSNVELKDKVLNLFEYGDNNYGDNYQYSSILFDDFGTNADFDDGNAEVALLAQAVFDTKIQLLAELEVPVETKSTRAIEYYSFTAAQFITFYEAVLPKVSKAVDEKIEEIKTSSTNSSVGSYTIKVNIPGSMTAAVVNAIKDIEAATLANDTVALATATAALASAKAALTPKAEIKIISVDPVATGGTGAASAG